MGISALGPEGSLRRAQGIGFKFWGLGVEIIWESKPTVILVVLNWGLGLRAQGLGFRRLGV